MMYIRFQSAVPNRHGALPGVFAMANGLLRKGMLSPEDEAWARAANAEGETAYTDPSTVIPDCYDRATNPGARSWFKENAAELLEMTMPYLSLLDRYGVPWQEVRSADPGRIVYEDGVQVVAVPPNYAENWPLVPSL
jgi:hypothetical protein